MKHTTLAIALAAAAALPAAARADDGGLTADERGITLEQGPLELNLGGRIHLDAAVFDEPATGRTGQTDVAFRRARLELSGKVADVVRFRVDREFAGGSKGWRNLWLGLEPVEDVQLRGGNMMVPFSAEDLQSSNTMPFAERSLASALSPGYGLGGQASASGKRWSAAAGWFTDPLDNDDGRSVERGRGLAGRATVLAVDGGKARLHLGLAGERRSLRAAEVLRLSADPGSVLAPSIMTSGALRDIRRLNGWNAEAGLSFGPLLVQAQALGLSATRRLLPDLRLAGQTVQAAWLVTGGRHAYARSTGNFAGPDLKKGGGALELAVRYSRLDLRDGAFDRGVGRALTGGVNWYLNRNIRLLADYTDTRVRFAGAVADRSNKVGVARLQVAF